MKAEGNPECTESHQGQPRASFPNIHRDASQRQTPRDRQSPRDLSGLRETGQRDAFRDPRRQRHRGDINTWLWRSEDRGIGRETEPAIHT